MAQPSIHRAIALFLERLARQQPLAGAILYGSRARGDDRPDSDVDLAVLLPGERAQQGDLYAAKLAMADLAFDVLLETGVLISALPIWQAEWSEPQRHANPRLLENIKREGVTV